MGFSSLKKANIFFIIAASIAIFDLAIFFYLPLLSNIRQELNVSEPLIQFSVAMNLLGIGISSVIYGTISDAWGRKNVVFFGMLCFAISSYCISHITSIQTLLTLRFFQGIGAGVAWSVGNAILHDIHKGKAFERAIIALHMVIGVMLIISPSLGSYIGSMIGWRESFQIMGILGFLMFLYIAFFLPETLQNTKSKINTQSIINNYRALFKNSTYVKYMIVKVLMVSVAFVNISSLPLIFIERYNASIEYCGNLMAFGALVFVIGGFINNKLINYFSINKIIQYSILLISISGIILVIAEAFDYLTPLKIQILYIPYLIGIACIFGNATHKIVGAMPKLSGSASATMITFEMLSSSVFLKLVSTFYNQTLYPIEIFLLIATSISFFCIIGFSSSHEEDKSI